MTGPPFARQRGLADLLLLPALLAWLPHTGDAFGEASKYLLVSSPSTHRIVYSKLPKAGCTAGGNVTWTDLVTTDLSVPQGLAVDQYRKKLYVADPDLGRLVSYDLTESGDSLKVGAQTTVAASVEPRWVTVDGVGNVFFSDEAKNHILKVSAAAVEGGDTKPEILFDGTSVPFVSGPGGVVADNFFVYWVNKLNGETAGSLVRGVAAPVTAPVRVSLLAQQVEKSFGVCIARGHIFFTENTTNVHVQRRTGGALELATSSLAEPRGCAFDGDGTVYVADKGRNAVYSLTASAEQYTAETLLTQVAPLQGAFGLAVYTKVIS